MTVDTRELYSWTPFEDYPCPVPFVATLAVLCVFQEDTGGPVVVEESYWMMGK